MATVTVTITPIELAEVLDVAPIFVRNILRAEYEDDAPGKGGRWEIDEEMAAKVAEVVQDWRQQRIDWLFTA